MTSPEMLSFLGEMHQFHISRADLFDQYRISGLQIYIGSIAVLTVFIHQLGQGLKFLLTYRFLISLATVLAVMFQLYWHYYARNSEGWATKYFSQIANKENLSRPLNSGACYDSSAKKIKRNSWRVRKANEIRDSWLKQRNAVYPNPDGGIVPGCSNQYHWSDVFLSPRQFNIWFISLLLFYISAMVLSPRLFTGAREKSPSDLGD